MREFQVGDRCRIRSWDDMKSEFGLNDTGSIDVPKLFTPLMRELCGRDFTIKDITENSIPLYKSEERIEYIGNTGGWQITGDMLELASPEREMKPATSRQLEKLLGR